MDDRTPADGSITGELREWGDARFVSKDDRDAIERMADRIDEDHERAVEKAHCDDISDIGDDELSSLYGLVLMPSGCVHRRPTPAERIRRCVGWVEGCYRDHGTLDAAVLDELRAIADELEGDE